MLISFGPTLAAAFGVDEAAADGAGVDDVGVVGEAVDDAGAQGIGVLTQHCCTSAAATLIVEMDRSDDVERPILSPAAPVRAVQSRRFSPAEKAARGAGRDNFHVLFATLSR